MNLLTLAQGLELDPAALVLRVLHIASAAMAAGAVAFQFFALHPAMRSLEGPQRRELRETIIGRWRGFVFTLIGLLLATGMLNFLLYKVPELRGKPHAGLYHGLFGLKVVAALLVFHAVSMLALPGAKGEKFRDQAGFWLKLLVVLMAVIFVLAAVLKSLSDGA